MPVFVRKSAKIWSFCALSASLSFFDQKIKSLCLKNSSVWYLQRIKVLTCLIKKLMQTLLKTVFDYFGGFRINNSPVLFESTPFESTKGKNTLWVDVSLAKTISRRMLNESTFCKKKWVFFHRNPTSYYSKD